MARPVPRRTADPGTLWGAWRNPSRGERPLLGTAHLDPQSIVDHLVAAGETWAGVRPADDDVTFVVLKIRADRPG